MVGNQVRQGLNQSRAANVFRRRHFVGPNSFDINRSWVLDQFHRMNFENTSQCKAIMACRLRLFHDISRSSKIAALDHVHHPIFDPSCP